MPEFTDVVSSHIEAVAHFSENEDMKNDTLQIRFKGGRVYEYEPVDEEMYDQMMEAESIGKWYHQNLLKNSLIEYREI